MRRTLISVSIRAIYGDFVDAGPWQHSAHIPALERNCFKPEVEYAIYDRTIGLN